jgi:CheY-like chemotaxis protein
MEESPDAEVKRRDYLHRVLYAGRRAKNLVQQILRFSRPDEVAVTTIAVTPLVKESVKLMQSILPKTIQVEQRLDADIDTICGDATQIHQVIMNLCTNAYHAMRDDGGVLALSLRNVSLTAPRERMSMRVPPGEYLQLGISDTGCGIETQVSGRIFDPYFTTKRGSEGSGLGLSVTLGIVKGHKGLIEVESNVGEGTRFDIYLPVARSKAVQKESQADSLPVGRQENILVVDDERFFLDVVRDSLEYLGYRVKAHASSLKALEVFKEDPTGFDLLVTDQTMPEMTGVQLIAEIRKIHRTIPVLLCTGYSETVTEETAGYYGITQFLMKPVSTKDLAMAVHEVLDGKRIGRGT